MTPHFLDCTVAEYHRDPLPTPSLSPSIARTLVMESAAHAWLRHPKLGGTPSEATASTKRGELMHRLLLGAGADLVVVDADDFKKKVAQEARDAALDAGKIPVLRHVLADAEEATEKVRKNLADQGIVLAGKSEHAMAWAEKDENGEDVVCRGMLDHHLDGSAIYDLKTTVSAQPNACERKILEYGYDIQAVAYTRGLRQVLGLDRDPHFLFLFVENEAPFCVTVGEPSGTVRELGLQRWERAINTWARCLKSGKWPGYSERPVLLHAPTWAINQEISNQENAA